MLNRLLKNIIIKEKNKSLRIKKSKKLKSLSSSQHSKKMDKVMIAGKLDTHMTIEAVKKF